MASGVPGEALAVPRSGAQPWPRLHPPGPLATVGVLSPQAAVRSPTCTPEGGCQHWRVPGLGEWTGRGGWSAGQLQVPFRAGGVPPCRETQRPKLWGSAEQGCRAQGAEASAEQGRACAADGEGRAPSRTPFSPGTGARGPAVSGSNRSGRMGAPYGFGRWVTSGAQLPLGLGAFGALSAVRLACQVTEGRLRGRRGSGPKRGVCIGGRGRDSSPTNGWGGSDGVNDPRGLERQPERGGHMGRGGWKVTAPGTGGRDQAVWMWKVLRPREESRGKRRTQGVGREGRPLSAARRLPPWGAMRPGPAVTPQGIGGESGREGRSLAG